MNNKKAEGKVVGIMCGAEGADKFKNTIQTYIKGVPVYFKTDMTQEEWDYNVSHIEIK